MSSILPQDKKVLAAGARYIVPHHEELSSEKEARQLIAVEVGDLELPAEGEVMTAEMQANIDRRLNYLRLMESELQDIKEVAALRKHDIDRWAESASRSFQYRADIIRMELMELARRIGFPAGKKSLSLPNGVVGRRSKQGKIEIVDKGAALAFSKKNGIPTKEEASLSELKDFWLATKQLPDGCTEVPGGEDPYVK